MKRSLLLSIFAVAIVATTFGQAMAAITLSLNLRYNDPADVTEGGSWDLLATTDSAFGIASVVAVIDNIDLAGITLNSGIGALPIESKITGTVVEFVYGQNLNAGQQGGVGKGAGTAGNVPQDDLFGTSGTTYDNFAKIASGTFGGLRPSIVTGATGIAGNEFTNAGLTTVTATDPAFVLGGGDGVRGDSVAVDGLKQGDANRDGIVNTGDLSLLLANFNGTPRTWDQGNFNDDALVNTGDLSLLLANFNAVAANPAISAVPEPSSALLALLALSLGVVRRRA